MRQTHAIRMTNIPAHLVALHGALVSLPVTAPPSPWVPVNIHAVGGLTDVAFADGTDLLLVLSAQGRGVLDCASGVRVARDPSESYPFDEAALVAEGIDMLAGRSLRTAGLHGGGLALTTRDGWTLDVHTLTWPTRSVFLTPPGHWLYDPTRRRPLASTCVARESLSELRAAGFSPTGQTFVIATSSDVALFRRST